MMWLQNYGGRWFAWHPVVITKGEHYGAIVWLEYVQRDRISRKYAWQYRGLR